MHDYLKSLGGSPFISGDSWKPHIFHITKLFDAEADHAMSLFFDHKLQKCQHPDNSTAEILCFKHDISWNDTSLSAFNDTVDMLIEMARNIQGQKPIDEIESMTSKAKKAAAVVQQFYRLKVFCSCQT